MLDEDDRGAFGEFAGDIMNEGGDGGGWHSSNRTEQMDQTLSPASLLPQDIAPDDDRDKFSLVAENDDNSAPPPVPKPPEHVDWDTMLDTYAAGRPWMPGAEYCLLPGGLADPEMRTGETALSISNFEAIMRPLAYTRLAQCAGVCDCVVRWTPAIDRRLAVCGIRLCAPNAVSKDGATFSARMYHVHWRVYACVLIHNTANVAVGTANFDIACAADDFAGYHYIVIDKRSAVINKCQ
jgi:hypothetical protein